MNHIQLQECASTQAYLKEQLRNNSPSSYIVSASNQTSGKGQGENKWDFYPGSLAFSFNLSPQERVQLTSLEIGILICEYFNNLNISVKIKWPNDLIFNNSKIGGVLCELFEQQVVCGVGINIGEHQYSKSYRTRANGIKITLDKTELINNLVSYILKNRLNEKDILEKFNSNCDHINEDVSLLRKSIIGKFVGINNDGACIIKDKEDKHEIYSDSLLYRRISNL